MAYLEIRQNGELVKRREVDANKAQNGLRIRLGSLGKVLIKTGQPVTLGDYDIIIKDESIRNHGMCSHKRLKQSLPPMPLIDGYRITDHIGAGGMGTVWHAIQLSTKREVALKCLGGLGEVSKRAKARFEREVTLAARLTHPNIARIYDSGLYKEQYFYVMELIQGQHLHKYIRSEQCSRTARSNH